MKITRKVFLYAGILLMLYGMSNLIYSSFETGSGKGWALGMNSDELYIFCFGFILLLIYFISGLLKSKKKHLV